MAREAKHGYNQAVMDKIILRRFAAQAALLLGLSFTILGIGMMLVSAGGSPRTAAIPASLFMIAGAAMASLAVSLRRRPRYLFFASLLIQTGILLLLVASEIIVASFSMLWPFISIFAGIALVPAGWYQYGRLSGRYIVPTLCFLGLGSLLLIFSFDIVSFSFKRFFLDWWPLMLILAGIVLTLISLSSRTPREHEGP
ncbi:hypothetical protein MASR2M78_05500 [Treponema sp.]